MASICWGSKNPRPRQGFNVKSLTNIPTISYAKYPPPPIPPLGEGSTFISPLPSYSRAPMDLLLLHVSPLSTPC